MSDIRMAGPEDEAGVRQLCIMAHAEQAPHALNIDKTMVLMRMALNRQRGIIGVVGTPDDVRSMILLVVDPIWYSDEFQLLELMNFVHPDHRRSTYAKQMIEFAKKCSRELGLDLTIGVFSNIRTEAKVRLYERQLPKVGAFFCYRPSEDTSAKAA